MEFASSDEPRLYSVRPGEAPQPLSPDPRSRSAREWIACVNDATRPLLSGALEKHSDCAGENTLIVLVEPRPAPMLTARNDGPTVSFVASGSWLTPLLHGNAAPVERLCYEALRLAVSRFPSDVHIRVVHSPEPCGPSPPVPCRSSAEVVIPHLGCNAHLRASVESIRSQTHPCEITVCFDQSVTDASLAFLPKDPRLAVFAASPHPVGPYVIRQHFGIASQATFLAFQDSDDYSLRNRIRLSLACAELAKADIVGCHELRLDEIHRTVEAVRFPLDVNAALQLDVGHAQLFPTTLVRSDFFRKVGGLSTSRRFGSDLQFLLRAHWFGRIVNIDEFLYVRRRRRESLTTARSTGLRSPRRRVLTWIWKKDFTAIREGRRALSKSSLEPTGCSKKFTMRHLAGPGE